MEALKRPDLETPKSKRLTDYLNKAQLKVVGVRPEMVDKKMKSYSSVIDKLIPDNDDRKAIVDWLAKLRNWNKNPNDREKPTFVGTLHCETILLSPHALSLPIISTTDIVATAEDRKQALRGHAIISEHLMNLEDKRNFPGGF